MKVFKPLSPDALHNLRVLLEAADKPNAIALEQAVLAINRAEAYQDAIRSGLVPRVTPADVNDFIKALRERFQVDASRRTLDRQAKKSQLRADQADDVSQDDTWLSDELHGFMQGRTAVQNKGSAMVTLGEIVALAGGQIARWLTTERLNVTPNLPDFVKFALGLRSRVEAEVKAA